MLKFSFFIFLCACATSAIGCSGCGEDSNAPDSGVGPDGDSDADADSDADSDTDTDSDSDTDSSCASGTAIFDWIPNPEGEDCGPGCTQLVFQEINTMTQWSVSSKYLAVTTLPEVKLLIVDIENNCYSIVEHPTWAEGENPGFLFPWVAQNAPDVVSVITRTSYAPYRNELIEFDMNLGEWQSFNYIEGPTSERGSEFRRDDYSTLEYSMIS